MKGAGYTKFSNAVLQALPHISVCGGVKDVFLIIVRLTCGWQRREQVISYNDLCLLTGHHHRNLCRYVKKALEVNMITRYLIGTEKPRYCYSANLDPHTWKVPWRIKPRDFSRLLTKLMSVNRLTKGSVNRLTNGSVNRLTDVLGIIIDTPIR